MEQIRAEACASCERCIFADAGPIKSIPFEIHITVSSAEIAAFRAACTALGVKPLFLALQLAAGGAARDVMTSSVHFGSDESVLKEASRISSGLSAAGFDVVRTKIETAPWHPSVPTLKSPNSTAGLYFEAHLAVSCRETDRPRLSAVATTLGLHLSRNVMKQSDDGTCIIMATVRDEVSIYESFRARVDDCRAAIAKSGFAVDKVIVEYVLLDDRVEHDAAWTGRSEDRKAA